MSDKTKNLIIAVTSPSTDMYETLELVKKAVAGELAIPAHIIAYEEKPPTFDFEKFMEVMTTLERLTRPTINYIPRYPDTGIRAYWAPTFYIACRHCHRSFTGPRRRARRREHERRCRVLINSLWGNKAERIVYDNA